MHSHTKVYIYIYIYIYTHTHTHTLPQALSLSLRSLVFQGRNVFIQTPTSSRYPQKGRRGFSKLLYLQQSLDHAMNTT